MLNHDSIRPDVYMYLFIITEYMFVVNLKEQF